MLKATLKGLLAHKLRLGMSAVAIIHGVALGKSPQCFAKTSRRVWPHSFRERRLNPAQAS